MKHIVRVGTEVKINVHLERMGEVTMDNYEWSAEVYTIATKVVKVSKGEAIRVDEDNYVVTVDTAKTGVGGLRMRVTADVPDGDFADGLRREIVLLNTDIEVVR